MFCLNHLMMITYLQLFDSVYYDLTSLCIPLTPSNVIMYMTIIFKDGDFKPLNMVDIVSNYLNRIMEGQGDAYYGTFTAKNKLDLISAFSFSLYDKDRASFSETDWFKFCDEYKAKSLIEFGSNEIFRSAVENRIFIGYNGLYVIKYKFFFSFFVGRHVSLRGDRMRSFLDGEQYLRVPFLAEVITGLSSDSTALILDITSKLEKLLDEFSKKYVDNEFDPFDGIRLELKINDEGEMWDQVFARIDKGPHSPTQIDEIKRSLVAERMTERQAVAFQQFDQAERKMFALHFALENALKNSEVDGDLKIRAARAILLSYFKLFQVTVLLGPVLAKAKYISWSGILFINTAQEQDAKAQLFHTIVGFMGGVVKRASSEFGARQLGLVFRKLSDEKSAGFNSLLLLVMLMHSKPTSWSKSMEIIINNTDRKGFYIIEMLALIMKHFSEDVISSVDREELKRLVALIKAKRGFKKDNVGSKGVEHALRQLEEKGFFGGELPN